MVTISDFLRAEANYVTRERIFLDKIMYDLRIAAARASVPIQIFTPDVDRYGFDIILDDADLERRFQLKTVLASSTTESWQIHKRLLRPTMYNAMPLEFAVPAVGIEGGVILMMVDDSSPECPVAYYYTDVFILTAFAGGLIRCENKYRKTQAQNVLTGLRAGAGIERVPVPIGTFVKLKSPSCLLAIGGFHSTEDSYFWYGNLLSAYIGNFTVEHTAKSKTDADMDLTSQAAHAASSVLSLTEDATLHPFKEIPVAQ